MFSKIDSPAILQKSELDAYLEKGWYRMGQEIFTCNFLNFNRIFYSSIWLRLELDNYEPEKEFKKLQKLNASFRVEINKASITDAKEKLYSKYKAGITFDTSDSLESLLMRNEDENKSIYDTHEVCIYEEDKLIAVGFFDLGDKSVAGIVSFYHPHYKKYSLGKYLIYNKIHYCKTLGFHYFYPGYFAPDYSMFDYKLKIGKSALEFLNLCTNQWQVYSTFSEDNVLIDVMEDKLIAIQSLLLAKNIQVLSFKYEFFNANIMFNLRGLDLLDYPLFLLITDSSYQDFQPIIIFDVIEQKYRLIKCVSYYFDEEYVSKDGYYGTHLLKQTKEFIAHKDANSILDSLTSLPLSAD